MADTGPSIIKRIDNFMRGVANGLSFGLMDDVAGVANSVTFGGTIKENIAAETAKTEQARKEGTDLAAGTLIGTVSLGLATALRAGAFGAAGSSRVFVKELARRADPIGEANAIGAFTALGSGVANLRGVKGVTENPDEIAKASEPVLNLQPPDGPEQPQPLIRGTTRLMLSP